MSGAQGRCVKIEPATYTLSTFVSESDEEELPGFDENIVEEYLSDEVEVTDEDVQIIQEEDIFNDGECTEELYNCNACGMEFSSVQQHIDEFHSEQDVILDVDDKTKADDIYNLVLKEEPIDGSGGESSMTEFAYDEEYAMVENENDQGDVELDADGETHETITDAVKKTHKCLKCDKKFDTLRSLSTHLMSVHKSQLEKRKMKTVKKLPVKKLSSDFIVVNNDHTCSICNTVFLSAKSLKLHARMHNPIKMKTLEEAAEHELETIHMNEEEDKEKFFCGICDKHYSKAFEEIHVQMHNGEEKFNCKICNKLFPNETSLAMHSNAHQEARVIRTKAEVQNIKLPYGCQYCPKEFARPYEKVKHERVHTGEKPYECEICGKCFRVSYCLTIHMRTHTDARPYVCPHCNKRFKAHSVYNHHLLTHSDARNYKCPYCPKSFKTSVQLSGHKNSHTKPFSCTECNRPFGTLYAVRTHMETHRRPNNNMKHCCEICGAKYARSFALKDHIKEQHKHVAVIDAHVKVSKKQTKRTRTNAIIKNEVNQEEVDYVIAKNEFISVEDEEELEAAGQSILPNVVEQEITISEISHYENEEEVVGIDWLK